MFGQIYENIEKCTGKFYQKLKNVKNIRHFFLKKTLQQIFQKLKIFKNKTTVLKK